MGASSTDTTCTDPSCSEADFQPWFPWSFFLCLNPLPTRLQTLVSTLNRHPASFIHPQGQQGYLTVETGLQNNIENCIGQDTSVNASFSSCRFPYYDFASWNWCSMWTLDAGVNRAAAQMQQCLSSCRCTVWANEKMDSPDYKSIHYSHYFNSVLLWAQLNYIQFIFSVKFVQKPNKEKTLPQQQKLP